MDFVLVLQLNVMFLNKFVVPFRQSVKKLCTTDGGKRKPKNPGIAGNFDGL